MKKKVLLSLDEEIIELLNKGAKEHGINKSQFITRLLKDNVENRLSKYIARDIENLILYLLLQNDNLKNIDKNKIMEKMDFIYNQTKIINNSKSLFIKEQREKKKNELKNFWNQILELLEPENFKKNISENGKYNNKKARDYLKQIYDLVNQNKKLWE